MILSKVIFQGVAVIDLPGYQFQDPCPPRMRKVRYGKSPHKHRMLSHKHAQGLDSRGNNKSGYSTTFILGCKLYNFSTTQEEITMTSFWSQGADLWLVLSEYPLEDAHPGQAGQQDGGDHLHQVCFQHIKCFVVKMFSTKREFYLMMTAIVISMMNVISITPMTIQMTSTIFMKMTMTVRLV